MKQTKFECRDCHQYTAVYSYKDKCFRCYECGAYYIEQPTIEYCECCHYPYIKLNWFDPSGCPNCGHSFVN